MGVWVCEVCIQECRGKAGPEFWRKGQRERTVLVWICVGSPKEKAVPGAWAVESLAMQLESLVCPSHLPLEEKCPRDTDHDVRKHLTLAGAPPPICKKKVLAHARRRGPPFYNETSWSFEQRGAREVARFHPVSAGFLGVSVCALVCLSVDTVCECVKHGVHAHVYTVCVCLL